MSKSFAKLTPNELNDHLIKRFGLGLYPFARSLYIFLWYSLIYKDKGAIGSTLYVPSTRIQKLKELRKRISNTETKSRDLIADYEKLARNKLGLIKLYKSDKVKWAETLDNDDRIKDWILQLRILSTELDLIIIMKKQSSQVRKLGWLFGVWAFQLRERYGATKPNSKDWEVLSDLFKWFWVRLSPHERYMSLEPKKDIHLDPDYIKNQFCKFIERWKVLYINLKYRMLDNFGNLIIFGKDDCYIFDRLFFSPDDFPPKSPDEHLLLYFCKICSDSPNIKYLIGFPDLSYWAY